VTDEDLAMLASLGNPGQAFEWDIAVRLTQLGWNTSSTPTTGDWGADIVAQIGHERLVVQCKDWSTPVGVAAVQEIAFARTYYKADTAAVVSRSGYTKAAREAARSASVLLLKPGDLHLGSSLVDRSKEGALLREEEEHLAARAYARAAEADAEGRAAEAWQRFDDSLRLRRRLPFIRHLSLLTLLAGATALGCLLLDGSIAVFMRRKVGVNVSDAAAVIALGILLMSSFLVARSPKEPQIPRRSALRDCPLCNLRLRLDVGRSGWLTCPRCKWRFHADTRLAKHI
jgi:hypothetical protein